MRQSLLLLTIPVKLIATTPPHWIWSIYINYLEGIPSGTNEYVDITLATRWQWLGINGAPFTFFTGASIPTPSEKFKSVIAITYDKLGVSRNAIALLTASWQPLSTNVSRLELIAGINAYLTTMNPCELTLPSGESPCALPDPAFPTGKTTSLSSKYFVLGLQYTYNSLITLATVTMLSAGKNAHVNRFIAFLHEKPLSDKLKAGGGLQLYFNIPQLAIWQLQLQGWLIYKEQWLLGTGALGITRKTFNDLLILAGWRYNRLWIYYSYGVPLSGISSISKGSHEIAIRYQVPVTYTAKVFPIIYSPRLF